MESLHPIIIIGTGLAGYQLAREFRKLDQITPLTLITTDNGSFYSKPLLSTALTQKKDVTTLTTATADAMSSQLNATIMTQSEVTSIDPNKKIIVVNKNELPYSKLVLACGAEVIKPQLQGNAVDDVISVNHLHDYATFQELLQNKRNITILGAGLIGCEFANDLINADYHVNVVTLGKTPLDLLIPEKIGQLLQHALELNGVQFHFECTAKSVTKNASGYALALSNGMTINTDLVLSAIGLKPRITLAASAGITTQRGIIVNRYLETNVHDIFALGDCAEVEGHVLPYITPLLNAGRALAKTLTNEKTAVDYPAMPVMVKTPAHPLAICPPPKETSGTWKIETEGKNVRALFHNAHDQLCGFVLTNDAVKERMALAKQIPGFFK